MMRVLTVLTTTELNPFGYDYFTEWSDQEAMAILPQIRKMALQALTFDRFELSVRARNSLVKAACQNVWDAAHLSRRSVEAIPYAGAKVREEVYRQVKHGSGVILANWAEER